MQNSNQNLPTNTTVTYDPERALNYLHEVLAVPEIAVAEAHNALCLAVQFGFLDILNRLLEIPAVQDAVAVDGNNPLALAAINGHIDIVNRLLDIPAVRDLPTIYLNLALRDAAEHGHLAVVERFLRIPIILENIAIRENLVFYIATANGHLAIVERLLDIPAVRDATADLYSAACVAAANGHLAILERLLQIPAVRDAAAAYNNYVLRSAVEHGHLTIVNRLLEIPAVRDAVITGDNHALRQAAENDHLDIVYRLLDIQACSDWVRTNEDPNIINTPWFITIRNAYEQKIVRKTALEVAHSAYSNLKVDSELAYPEGNNSDYATQFAMGIVAQLKNTPDTPNPIMNKILSYYPFMDGKRPNQCIELAAMRPQPTLAVAESIDPVPNQFKRQSEGSGSEPKRQKQSDRQDEMKLHGSVRKGKGV